jgi:hypothetical protein
MLERLRRGISLATNGFMSLLDSESVKLYVWPYYLALWLFGTLSVFAPAMGMARPKTVVELVMGNPFYQAWVWVMILGTTQVMVGLVWSNKYTGLLLQLGGNGSAALVLFAYEIAAYSVWGYAAFSFYVIGPYVLGCVFLSLTALRKLYLVERTRTGEPCG